MSRFDRSMMVGVAGLALALGMTALPAEAFEVCPSTGAVTVDLCADPGDAPELAAKPKKRRAKPKPYQFNPRNPYARKKPRDANQVRVRQLIVLGDEESVAGGSIKVWWEWQRDRGLFRKVTSLARAGATGGDTANDIAQQMDDLLQKKKKKKKNKPRPDKFRASKRALTVVQFGLNDITQVYSTSELDDRWTFMEGQLDRLKNAGATAKGRKVFLILPHDVGRQPGWDASEAAALRNFSIHWARKLSDYATPPSSGFVAVDALTFFDRVMAKPSDWGLSAATDIFSGSRFDTVYSEAGQKLLGALVEHYLTQGWNWANTLDPGVGTTVPQLISDIDNGLIDAYAFASETETPVFGFTVGDTGTSSGTAFTAGDGYRGIGIGWRLGEATGLAFVHAENTDGIRYAGRFGEERATVRGGLDGFALVHEGEGYVWTARVLWGREDLTRSRFDALSGEAVRGGTEVTSLRLGQRLETAFTVGGATLSPWLGLEFARRQVDGYALDDPYVGRVRFGDATLDERTLELGLRFAAPERTVEGLGTLRLSGELAWVRDFSDRTVALAITEGRTRRVETVELPSRDALRLGLSATLMRGDGLSLGADWGMVRGEAGTDQRVGFRLGYRFPVD